MQLHGTPRPRIPRAVEAPRLESDRRPASATAPRSMKRGAGSRIRPAPHTPYDAPDDT